MYPYKYKSRYGNKYQSKYDNKYQCKYDNKYQSRTYRLHHICRPVTPCISLGIISSCKSLLSFSERSYKCIQKLFHSKNNDQQSNICSEQNCSICLSALHKNDRNTKWICKHRFHKECIESWNGSCPLCRCDYKLLTSTFYDYKDEMRWVIELYLKMSKIVSIDDDVKMLKLLWKHSKCISENHEITFHCTNHIAGICHNCSIVDNNFGDVHKSIIQN